MNQGSGDRVTSSHLHSKVVLRGKQSEKGPPTV